MSDARWQRIGRAAIGGALLLGSTVTIALDLPGTPASAATTACGTNNTPTVVALADPHFYVDTSLTPALDSTYVGYTVRAGTSSETGLRMQLSGFTGGVVALAPGQPAATVLPNIPAGSTATAYFLLAASGLTTTAQTHTISLYRGQTLACERTFTYAGVNDTIKALANKVDSVSGPTVGSTASIGDLVEVTVQGHTGTLGAGPSFDPGVLSYAPTALSGFPAASWRLERTRMTISPDGSAAPVTYTDRLYLSGASGPDRPYTAVYSFRAIAPAASSAKVQPVQYIASGTQVKHTDLGGSAAGLLPTVPNDANLSVQKTASVLQFNPVGGVTHGGTVTYTVTITNTGTTTGSLDSLVDTLPAGTTYADGSARINGRTATPSLVGSTLTFYGPILVAAGGTTTVTYDVTIPNVAGRYTNSAIGTFAATQIDGSTDVTRSDPATVTVTVVPASLPVNAVDDTTSTNADTLIIIHVLANDTGTGLSISSVGAPGNGTAVISGTDVHYTPSSGFGGRDTFTYTITDGYTEDTATVTVAVPQARNDVYAKQASTNGASGTQTLTVAAAQGLLANDFCSATPCTVARTSTYSAGTLTLASDGSFTYVTPTSTTTVTFTYQLTDNNGRTASATVTIYVSDFGPDRATTPFNTAVVIPVTANDSCTGTCNPTVSASFPPSHGSATSSGNNITYTPNTGFWGLDEFRYSKGGSGTTALVTVLVGPPAATFATPFGTPVAGKALASTGYVAGVTLVSCTGCTYSVGTAPTKGSVAIGASTGTWSYTPADGAAGTDTFTVVVTEPGGMSIAASVTINIKPDAIDDAVTVFASTLSTTRTVSFDVTANDTCPTTCTVTITSAPATGTLTQTGTTGAFTYSNRTAIGDVTFTYSETSSVSPTVNDTATVTIHVDGAADDDATTSPGIPVGIDVLANDPCPDCTLGTVGTPSTGTATALPNHTVSYEPPAGFAGVATFTYTVTKGGNSTSATVTVTVGPAATDDAYSVVLSTQYTLSLLDNDVCAACLITSVGTPSAGTATVGSTGLIVRYTAPASVTGALTFTYTITDSTGLTDTATVTLTVAVAPTAVDDTAVTPAGSAVAIDVDANDTCSVAPCTIDVASDATHGTVSLSVAGGGSLQYTPAPGFTGTDTFTYFDTSADNLSALATVTVRVTPTATDDHVVVGTGRTVLIDVLANDICSGCSPTIVQGVDGGSVGTVSAAGVQYTAPATTGTYTFVYRVTETDTSPASTADATVTILVSDAAPDAVATAHDTPVTFDVVANDACTSLSPSCTLTAVGTPSSGGAVIATGTTATFTPATGFTGLATFTYTATSGELDATATVTVLVGPAPLTRTVEVNTTDTGDVLSGTSCTGCTVTLVGYDGNGDLTVNPDGTWSYTPATDWLGEDAPATYRITDPVTGLTREGTLTITVQSTEPSVSVSKTAAAIDDLDANGPDAGDTIDYTYVVRNTGGVALTSVTVTDDRIAASGISCADGNGTDHVIQSLATATEVTCTATDTLDQADVDAGSVTNTASIAATAAGGAAGAVTANDSATVTITRTATLTLSKAAGTITETDEPANGPSAGDTIDYTYTVGNAGNVTLTTVTVTDDKIPATDIDCGDTTNVVATLAPGATTTCTATYTITQPDVDAAGVTNVAAASATAPDGATAPTDATDTATVAIAQSPTMTLTKSGSLVADTVAPDTRADVGDAVDYTYTVTNTGNVTLTGLSLSDDMFTADELSCNGGANTILSLAPTGSVTCNATHVLTQDDIDHGSVTNVATIAGYDPEDALQELSTDPVTVDVDRVATLGLEKVSGGVSDAGDTIDYTYTVENTGNVTLTTIAVTDDKIAAADIDCGDGTNTIATLAPAATADCTATYVITQADIDHGSVTNTATATGTAPTGATAPTAAEATVTQPITRAAAMTLTKVAGDPTDTDVPANGVSDAGDTIDYAYTVENTGNVTLTTVTVTDDKIAAADIDCGDTTNVVATLAPSATVTCNATYAITQADIDHGSVTNTATATATAPTGATAPSEAGDTATVALTPTPVPAGPDAVDDEGSAPMGAVVSVSVLTNDTGDGISVDYVRRPNAGSVSFDATTIVVTPPLDFVGDVNLRYGITDGTRTDEATVTVHVTENLHPIVPELFMDQNGDGHRDPGEPGIHGVPVTLELSRRTTVTIGAAAGAPTARAATVRRGVLATYTCETSADGRCRVDHLPVGTFDVRAGLVLADFGMVLSADPDGNGDLDAPALSGSEDPAVSFGLHGTASLSGTAFVQKGGGSGYDPGVDTTLGNHAVALTWAGPDGIFGTEDDVVFTTTTATDGTYTVTGLPGGRYRVAYPDGSLSTSLTAVATSEVAVAIGGAGTVDLPARATAHTSPLPASGADSRRPVTGAAVLVGLGGVLWLLARRRRTTTH